jgi:hypothetical protein
MYKRVLGASASAATRRAFSTTSVTQVHSAVVDKLVSLSAGFTLCARYFVIPCGDAPRATLSKASLRKRHSMCMPCEFPHGTDVSACDIKLVYCLHLQKDVVFVRGVRTPFVTSGGEFNDYMAYDLQVIVLTGAASIPGHVIWQGAMLSEFYGVNVLLRLRMVRVKQSSASSSCRSSLPSGIPSVS